MIDPETRAQVGSSDYETASLMPSAPPMSVPGYRIVRLPGQGGMGTVYLADEESLGRRVAIKVLLRERADDEASRARFRREARTMAGVEHPHVVRLYAFGTTGEVEYLAMEYVDGETLTARIQREGRLQEAEAFRLLRQILSGLEAAARQGIVHRDVKPSNVLLDRAGQVRLTDFGLAKPVAHSGGDASLSDGLHVIGTPHYVSPEQAQGHDVDFRTDIYSAGLVLYEMLTGERPFQGSTPMTVLTKRMMEPPPSLRAKRPDVSARAQQLYEWMVQRAREDRPSSYAALLEGLDAPTGDGTSPAPPLGPMPSSWSLPHKLGRRLKVRIGWQASVAIVLAAAVVGVVVGNWMLSDMVKAPPGPTAALVIAVCPFYGPDEASTREGRVISALIERAVAERFKGDVRVLGIEETGEAVRTHEAALALGERLKSGLVVWGRSLVAGTETETQPFVTVVPLFGRRPSSGLTRPSGSDRDQDIAAGLEARATGALVAQPVASSQIALRKTSAAEVGGTVSMLAGLYALYVARNPAQAIAYLDQAPRTSESLRYRAQSLLALGRRDEAGKAARQSIDLDPSDSGSLALLGRVHLQAGRFYDALALFRAALPRQGDIVTDLGFNRAGRLYIREDDAGTLLRIEPVAAQIDARFDLPGERCQFSGVVDAVVVQCVAPEHELETIRSTFINDHFEPRINARPAYYSRFSSYRSPGPAALEAIRLRVRAEPGREESQFLGHLRVPPDVLPEAEASLRAVLRFDPTNPWNRLTLGDVLWAQHREEEAGEFWRGALEAEPKLTFDQYAWMAGRFAARGERLWAERAFLVAVDVRQKMPVPVVLSGGRSMALFSTSVAGVKRPSEVAREAAEWQYLWLERRRQLDGFVAGEEIIAAVWAKYFAVLGDQKRRDHEDDVRARALAGPPISESRQYVRVDYRGHALAMSLVGLVILALLSGRRGSGHRAGMLALVAGGAVIGATWLASESADSLQRVYRASSLPYDAGGQAWALERELKTRPTQDLRFAVAVAHQMAGNFADARRWYREMGSDDRAKANLASVDRKERIPPRAISPGETYAVICGETDGWSPASFLQRARRTLVYFGLTSGGSSAGLAVLVLTAGLSVWIWRRGVGMRPGRFARAVAHVLPGVHDLIRGQIWIGYGVIVAFLSFIYGAFVFWIWAPAVGPASTDWVSYVRFFPGGLATEGLKLRSSEFWTVLWSLSGAPYFWGGWLLAGVLSVGYHLAQIKKIWRAE